MTDFSDGSFYSQDRKLGEVIAHEKEQFVVHQSLPLEVYSRKRLEFLQTVKGAGIAVSYLEGFRPSIGVFAGSFNPFHKGHYNILQKAERIFDKVIIAFGMNPDKDEQARRFKIPRTISNRQVEQYDSLLTDFISALGHDVVVIRGLRNSTDFQYEQNQYRYIQELMPDIRIVSIFCDKEFEHISSSGIRTLEKYNKHTKYLLD
jgi:pantetheine-phosphate adenylyltransferase